MQLTSLPRWETDHLYSVGFTGLLNWLRDGSKDTIKAVFAPLALAPPQRVEPHYRISPIIMCRHASLWSLPWILEKPIIWIQIGNLKFFIGVKFSYSAAGPHNHWRALKFNYYYARKPVFFIFQLIIQFMMSEDVKKLSQKPILSQTETWLWRTILLVERIYYLISRGKHENEEEIIIE